MRRLLPLVALLALLTAACRIESNIGAQINTDGSGVITAEIGYDKEAAEFTAPPRVEVTGRGSAGTALEGAGDFLPADELAESLSINLRLTLPGKILEH